MSAKSGAGFTLIELLVVISIIAILSVIGMAVYGSAQQRAADAKRKADVEAISEAFEVYYSASAGSYTQPKDDWFGSGGIPQDPDGTFYYWNGDNTKNPPAAAFPPTAVAPTYTICAKLKISSGNSSGYGSETSPFVYVSDNTGPYFCRKNLQ